MVAGAARLARDRAMLGLRPCWPSRSLTLAPDLLNESDRLPTTCPSPALRWRASAPGGDDSNCRHDGSRSRALARTAAPATAPGSRQDRRHRRRRECSGHCRKLAAVRRALPMPAVSAPVPVLADTTVRTSADAAAAPVGHDDGAARSRAAPEAARLILVNPPATAGFRQRPACIARVSPESQRIARALRRIARAMREGQAGPGEPPRRNPERPAEPAPDPPACQTCEASPCSRTGFRAVPRMQYATLRQTRKKHAFGPVHGVRMARALRVPCAPAGDKRSPGCDSPAAPGLAPGPFRALPLKRRSG